MQNGIFFATITSHLPYNPSHTHRTLRRLFYKFKFSFAMPGKAPASHDMQTTGIPMFQYRRGGSPLTPDERAAIARRRGICLSCGIKTHTVLQLLRRIPITNDDVCQGICIRCSGGSVPNEWQSQKGPAAAVKMGDTSTPTPSQGEALALPKLVAGANDGLQDSSAIRGEELGSIHEAFWGQQGRALEESWHDIGEKEVREAMEFAASAVTNVEDSSKNPMTTASAFVIQEAATTSTRGPTSEIPRDLPRNKVKKQETKDEQVSSEISADDSSEDWSLLDDNAHSENATPTGSSPRRPPLQKDPEGAASLPEEIIVPNNQGVTAALLEGDERTAASKWLLVMLK